MEKTREQIKTQLRKHGLVKPTTDPVRAPKVVDAALLLWEDAEDAPATEGAVTRSKAIELARIERKRIDREMAAEVERDATENYGPNGDGYPDDNIDPATEGGEK